MTDKHHIHDEHEHQVFSWVADAGDRRLSRRMVLAVGSFFAVTFLGRRYVAIAQTHPLYSNQVKIYTQGGYRHIMANGIPNHTTGAFPNQGNPNTIRPQTYRFRVPANPQVAQQITPAKPFIYGIAVNGVLFDPGTAEFWNRDRRWRYDALSGKINLGLDANNAHVQPGGIYHYHGLPVGLVHKLGDGARMVLLGYAADGFPIYSQYGYGDPQNRKSGLRKMRASYRLKSGQRPSPPDGPGGSYDGTFDEDYEYVKGVGDLDECNGRFGLTPEYPKGIYHYYITDTYPFISRNLRGTPDLSFRRPGAGPGQPPPGMPPGRPPGGFPPPGFPPDRPPQPR